MTEPIQIRVRVECPPEHAFTIWTERAGTWWPRAHSISKDPGFRVVIEPWVGGRILERTTTGEEHDWGEILVWEPPRRLVYIWHIYGARHAATEVEVSFASEDEGTVVTITHAGWERLTPTQPDLRGRNQLAWSRVLPHFVEACRATKTREGS